MTATDRDGETRTAPHDLEAETALLGSMMLSREALTAAINEGVTASDFYKPAHAAIFLAMIDAHTAGAFPDVIVTGAHLGDELDHVGGRKRLLEIMAATPASANATHYARILRRKTQRRDYIATGGDLVRAAYTNDEAALEHARDTIIQNPIEARSALTPVDLKPILAGDPPEVIPDLWARTDGHHLIYPGRIASLQTEPSQGKTWLVLHLCAEQILAGRHVTYVDVEADASALVERLRALGVPDHQIDERFAYLRPEGPLSAADRLALLTLVRDRRSSVVIFDTLAAILAMHGLNEDKAADVLAFLVPVCRPLAQEGAAVIVLDHVVKDKESRGRWARGSGGKLGELDAAYGLKTIQPFSRKTSGHVRLVLQKDRYGGIGTEGTVVADIYVTVSGNGAGVDIRIDPPKDAQTIAEEFQPTRAMQAVSEILESQHGVPLNTARIETSVSMKAKTVRSAIDALAQLGHIRVEFGARNAKNHYLVSPYREPVETVQKDEDRDLIF